MVPSTPANPPVPERSTTFVVGRETPEADASTYVTMKACRCQPQEARNLCLRVGILWLVNLFRGICVY